MTNLISNTGVVSTDTAKVGTGRLGPAMTRYGGDKAIVAFGQASGGDTNISNLISNTGVVGADVTGVGTARVYLGAAGYSISA